MLKIGDTIGIVACSNGKTNDQRSQIEKLHTLLVDKYQLKVLFSSTLYQFDETGFNGSPKEKADSLMAFYQNPAVVAIFDISGGNLANELLPYLDYPLIQENPKPFIGYSDLTVLLNGIYRKTGQPGVYYQLLNLVGAKGKAQQAYFADFFFHKNKVFIQTTGNTAFSESRVLGGNIRCFLKLAGTEFFPDLQESWLFLEANSGDLTVMATYLAQLQQLGCFSDCTGILLGQFSQIDQIKQRKQLVELIQRYVAPYGKPICQTTEVGHSQDSKALKIG